MQIRSTELENRQMEAQLAATAVRNEAFEARLSERISDLFKELRARDERLLDEQRVCFKQLSLETSETVVLQDRARRKAEALLEELTRRVERLESRKSRNRES